MHKWGSRDSFPYVITIFSAPNYCGSYKNKASVLILKNNNLQLKQYQDTEPPYQLPDGLDLFSWSLPFLSEKVVSMLYCILKQCSPAELAEGENAEEVKDKAEAELSKAQQKVKKKLVLRNKIAAVGKMSKMMGVLRENHEVLLEMKSMSPDGKLPRGALLENAKGHIAHVSKTFGAVRALDAVNEKNPKKSNKSQKKT